jgi:hypothetical protein
MLAGIGIIKATRYSAAHHLNLPDVDLFLNPSSLKSAIDSPYTVGAA